MPKVAKKKHVSMKKKSAWRKNTDITDVENFLEDQRLQERIGGDLTFAPNEELFQIEKKPLKASVSLRAERKLLAQKPAKCFISLENNSKVEDPIKKRNRVKTPEERRHPLTKAKIERNKKLGIIPQRQLESLKDRITAGKRILRTKIKKIEFEKDIWADDVDKKIPELESQWVSKSLKQYHLKNLGDDVTKVPQITHEKRSQIKAIENPIGGASYNPNPQDFEELINKAVEKEEKIIKTEKKLSEALKPLYKMITKGEAKRLKREELTQGFPINGQNDVDSELSESEFKTLNPPVRNKKKDLKQRRKQKESRLRKARLEIEKQELKKIKDLGTLKMFKKQLNKQDEKVEEKKKHRIEKKIKQKCEPRRIARKRFEGDELPVPDSMESLGTLRKIKPVENILVDRFKSLQKRNILAPNIKRRPRNRRLTTVKKKSHKQEDQPPPNMKKKGSKSFKIHK
ncbi:CLUMA_CG018939, isoform A [Clunio marinus]|uniref:Ribosome biogenesis protein NOP53 n=1 Tax=Clunio marinus TaxID=568069 RepID=A0A1J1J278_9DIPT|nr:CLUMA_CG018939, isoform A [Clunio marinus]